jgi:Flp pilus assembly CpaE family ATPase
MSAVILLVITPDVPSIWRTERLLNSLPKTNASSKIKVVLNRKTKNDHISQIDIEKLLHHPIDFTIPNDYAASMKAVNSGRLLDPKEGKTLAKAYRDLAEQIAGLPPADSRRGLLGLFLKSPTGSVSNA